jgi:hypothetical protein
MEEWVVASLLDQLLVALGAVDARHEPRLWTGEISISLGQIWSLTEGAGGARTAVSHQVYILRQSRVWLFGRLSTGDRPKLIEAIFLCEVP